MNAKRDFVAAIILALVSAALISRSAALAWMALPFLAYLAAGLLAAPGQARLSASRAVSQPRFDAHEPAALRLEVRNEGETIPLLRVSEEEWAGMRVLSGGREHCFRLPAGGQAALNSELLLPRGRYDWEGARLTASDPFGLFVQEVFVPAPARARVLPEPLPIRRLNLLPLTTLQAVGPNLSRLPGSGVSFWGVRAYHPGDPLRRVHWRLSARHPRQYFSKEFEREQMADIGLIVDGSGAGSLAEGGEELFEYSLQAAAGLARFLLRAGNRVSLLVLGDPVARVFPGTGKRQLLNILDALAGSRPGGQLLFGSLRYLSTRMFPSRALIVLVSPLHASDLPAVTRLRAEGYQVLLVSPDPVAYAVKTARDSLAVRAAQVERAALLWRVQELGVLVVNWPVDQPLARLVGRLAWGRR